MILFFQKWVVMCFQIVWKNKFQLKIIFGKFFVAIFSKSKVPWELSDQFAKTRTTTIDFYYLALGNIWIWAISDRNSLIWLKIKSERSSQKQHFFSHFKQMHFLVKEFWKVREFDAHILRKRFSKRKTLIGKDWKFRRNRVKNCWNSKAHWFEHVHIFLNESIQYWSIGSADINV